MLDGGRIVERGTHARLLAQNDVYARMWRLQQDEERSAAGLTVGCASARRFQLQSNLAVGCGRPCPSAPQPVPAASVVRRVVHFNFARAPFESGGDSSLNQ